MLESLPLNGGYLPPQTKGATWLPYLCKPTISPAPPRLAIALSSTAFPRRSCWERTTAVPPSRWPAPTLWSSTRTHEGSPVPRRKHWYGTPSLVLRRWGLRLLSRRSTLYGAGTSARGGGTDCLRLPRRGCRRSPPAAPLRFEWKAFGGWHCFGGYQPVAGRGS